MPGWMPGYFAESRTCILTYEAEYNGEEYIVTEVHEDRATATSRLLYVQGKMKVLRHRLQDVPFYKRK